MKNRNLKQMKRVLLGVFAVAIVSLATANLSFALNGGKYSSESLAKVTGENNEDSSEGCRTITEHHKIDDCEMYTLTICDVGNGFMCHSGFSNYNECTGEGWGYMSGTIYCD